MRPINYSRKELWVRVAGIIFCARCITATGVDWPQAATTLAAFVEHCNKSLPEDQQQCVSLHDYAYLRVWWQNFQEYGSVQDRHRVGRPRNINYLDALRAATIVKDGHLVSHKVKGKTVEHRVHYTSIAEAVRKNEELANMTRRLGMTPEQLLHAMHEADPDLVHRKIFFKHSFTTQELEQRMAFAKDCLQLHALPGGLLQNIIFIDEASIVIDKYTKSDVYVWCDRHDLSFSDVCPRKLPKEGSVTVRFIVAVTAHPAFADKGGLVYMDFTTGTTNIERKHNKRLDGSEWTGKWVYQVSLLHCPKPVVAICICVITAVGAE